MGSAERVSRQRRDSHIGSSVLLRVCTREQSKQAVTQLANQCSTTEAYSPINVPAPCCGRDSGALARLQGSLVAALIIVPTTASAVAMPSVECVCWNVLRTGRHTSPVVDAIRLCLVNLPRNQFYACLVLVMQSQDRYCGAYHHPSKPSSCSDRGLFSCCRYMVGGTSQSFLQDGAGQEMPPKSALVT